MYYLPYRLLLLVFLAFTGLHLASCVSSKKVVYLNNLADSSNAGISNARTVFESPIQRNDLLSIAVGGSNPDDLITLNSGSGVIPGASVGASKGIGYLVEADGTIQFPFLGRVYAAGLTRLQLEDTLASRLRDYTKNPVVNVKFMNYDYSVLGEVNHPGRFEMDNERTTIFDAIGMAGDLSLMGKRGNVLVIREVNGKREFGRLNLLSKAVFNSPYYYLKTNDIVYVEPVPSKFLTRTGVPQYIGIAAGAIALLLTLFNLTKL